MCQVIDTVLCISLHYGRFPGANSHEACALKNHPQADANSTVALIGKLCALWELTLCDRRTQHSTTQSSY